LYINLGVEVWLELNDKYCYKRIYINAGYKTSFQYHHHKVETNYIISGTAEVWLENDEGVVEKFIMKENEFFDVKPPRKHRVIALTDIILQEVSTPEVDDVVRIEDDTNRKDGKIDGEHQTPAICILAAGLGSRLNELTTHTNKALIPINGKATISHIIDRFPVEYDLVIAVGYKADVVEEYCKLAYPNRNIKFVYIDGYDKNGPGHSALACKEHLQRPFYLTTADCILNSELPKLDGNWLGASITEHPEQYSTIDIQGDDVVSFKNKSEDGYAYAFCGIAGILDYQTFWNELEKNFDGEVVSAFYTPQEYSTLKVKHIFWLDTGTQKLLANARYVLGDKGISLIKDTKEIVYKENDKFIKFIPDAEILQNKKVRADILATEGIIPPNVTVTNNFLSYDWMEGKTLYEIDSLDIFTKFLNKLERVVVSKPKTTFDEVTMLNFYYLKTKGRLAKFEGKFGSDYIRNSLVINGKRYESFESLFSKIDFTSIPRIWGYVNFHGDLQFDNIIYSNDRFYYIDWRDSFGGLTSSGDLYYDLAKLYGGILIPYNKMKDMKNLKFIENDANMVYNYEISPNLTNFKVVYEKWLVTNGFKLDRVKLITALIFANMSPLHEEPFAKMLICKAVELLSEYK